MGKKEFLEKHRQVNFYAEKELFKSYAAELEKIGVTRFSEDLLRYLNEVVSGKDSASKRFFMEKLESK